MKPFSHIAASILSERQPDLMGRLCAIDEPSLVLLLGVGTGRSLLGLSECFPNARIQGVAEDDFSLSISERLVKDKQNVQVLKSEELTAQLSKSVRTFDLMVVESSSVLTDLLRAIPRTYPLLRTGCSFLFINPPAAEEVNLSFLKESLGLSRIEEGWVSREESKPMSFLLGRK